MIRVVVNGACGRMGQRVATLVREDRGMRLVGGLERRDHPSLGKDLGLVYGLGEIGVRLTADLEAEADVLIDFSAPESTVHRAQQAAARGVAMVIGTTGLQDSHKSQLASVSQKIPCLVSPNMSLGVNLLFKIAGEVARVLGRSFDIEIVEAHHNLKKDAPSGTAVRLAEVVAEALGKNYPASAVHGRQGMVGERPRGQIGVHAVRGGDIVGDHTVLFAGPGERLELVHRAHSRDTFAQGALRAARFIAGKPPRLYTYADVLEAELRG
ncbi:MAG: 4-hydroxy-tetrahydrodipicolinate reductase [Planctomycetes bacterium]|nr:4-hydroxy-tetrahydrodipicolinate reductase [Planctomycetota bacterium]